MSAAPVQSSVGMWSCYWGGESDANILSEVSFKCVG